MMKTYIVNKEYQQYVNEFKRLYPNLRTLNYSKKYQYKNETIRIKGNIRMLILLNNTKNLYNLQELVFFNKKINR